MVIPDFFVEPANYQTDLEDLQHVRNWVFVVEQQIPPEVEFDELDPQCHHFLARDAQRQPIATGRLTADGRIGRMAVIREWRGQGVGQAVLRTLIEKARSLGLSRVNAHSQVGALGFYEKFGFSREGEVFSEAGIPHQRVHLQIPPLEIVHRMPKPVADSVPAERVETIDAAAMVSEQIISKARRALYIYSHELEFGLYGQAIIVESLKQFVLGNRNSMVQIIIQEPMNLRGQTHPVLELAQRLSSHFLIRSPVDAEDLDNQSAFIINDCGAYLFRLFGNRYEGHWSPNLPSRHRQLHEAFERVWHRSRPCSEFRALGL